MTFHYKYKKVIIISIVIILLLSISSYFGYTYYLDNYKVKEKEVSKRPNLIKKEENDKKPIVKEEKKKEEIEAEKYMVDIKGKVKIPGIYSLPVNSRVIDVINKAGGLANDADTSVINLSKKIKDEMVIIIYSKDEVKEFSKTKEKEEKVQDNCVNNNSDIKNDACIETNPKPNNKEELTGKVSINKGTIEDFMKLPGIGEAKAKDIIEYRNKIKEFKNIEEIKQVPGIGESLFAKIKGNITL